MIRPIAKSKNVGFRCFFMFLFISWAEMYSVYSLVRFYFILSHSFVMRNFFSIYTKSSQTRFSYSWMLSSVHAGRVSVGRDTASEPSSQPCAPRVAPTNSPPPWSDRNTLLSSSQLSVDTNVLHRLGTKCCRLVSVLLSLFVTIL